MHTRTKPDQRHSQRYQLQKVRKEKYYNSYTCKEKRFILEEISIIVMFRKKLYITKSIFWLLNSNPRKALGVFSSPE